MLTITGLTDCLAIVLPQADFIMLYPSPSPHLSRSSCSSSPSSPKSLSSCRSVLNLDSPAAQDNDSSQLSTQSLATFSSSIMLVLSIAYMVSDARGDERSSPLFSQALMITSFPHRLHLLSPKPPPRLQTNPSFLSSERRTIMSLRHWIKLYSRIQVHEI